MNTSKLPLRYGQDSVRGTQSDFLFIKHFLVKKQFLIPLTNESRILANHSAQTVLPTVFTDKLETL